ncbi:MAG: divalent-cation tolerance protein CutA [Planctomycetes bacterium]|nr:divalent-cation tolerance protein CutA [Planctomycetota bacterium]
MSQAIQVITTLGSRTDAQGLAHALIAKRAAACVQVLGPITSTYRWHGKIETAEEWLCIAKTTQQLYPEIEEAIRQAHPYELPEILALPVAAGSRDYLEWLTEQLRPSETG